MGAISVGADGVGADGIFTEEVFILNVLVQMVSVLKFRKQTMLMLMGSVPSVLMEMVLRLKMTSVLM
jgi:hypothetical protein